jgi:pimeloyl-ACP methyl ester carboxylesterase
MSDIFISYASEDRDRITPLVELLEAEGWTVWWDQSMPAGPRFDNAIDEAQSDCSCVIVAWSRHSVISDYVVDEATYGRERAILVPLRLDDVRPPLGFRAIQTANMFEWPKHPGDLNSLLSGVRALVDSEGRPGGSSKGSSVPMDPPTVRYVKSTDGTRIAYWTIGETGMPLVFPPSVPFSYGQKEWSVRPLRAWYEEFSRSSQLVRYDNRGTGLSDRDISEHSLNRLTDDLEAVVDAVGLGRFSLLGMGHSGPVSIEYAVRHPDRVHRLVLWCSYAKAFEYLQVPRFAALQDALSGNRLAAADALIGAMCGSSSQALKAQIKDLYLSATTDEYLALRGRVWSSIDVTDRLGQVVVPTLVMHRPGFPLRGDSDARDLATGIPNARLVALPGDSLLWFDNQSVTDTLNKFLAADL